MLPNKRNGSKTCRAFIVGLWIILLPRITSAQIHVEVSGGLDLNQMSDKPTDFYFVSESIHSKVSIYSVLYESNASAFAWGSSWNNAFANTYGHAVQKLCVTPCKLSLKPGFYSLRIADFFPRKFELNIGSSENELAYQVTNGSLGKFALGTGLFSIGILGLSFGIGTWIAGKDILFDNPNTGIVLTLTSLVPSVVGMILLLRSTAEINPMPPHAAKSQFKNQ